MDTTELRWFYEGPLPAEVTSWFTREGTHGLLEERCDVYRMDGRDDIGVKFRSRTTLELKIRLSSGEKELLSQGLQGSLEVWRKWSPADEHRVPESDRPWVEVAKTVVKRTYNLDGDEFTGTGDAPPMTGGGCDIEVVSVTIGDLQSWSFAFAAYGPPEGRRTSIVASWHALYSGEPPPGLLLSAPGLSSGYPEWLATRHGQSAITSLPSEST